MNTATLDCKGMNGINPLVGGEEQGICKPPECLGKRGAARFYPSFDIGALLRACRDVFGNAPIRTSALLRHAATTQHLAAPLGIPAPSARSLGRLLAARVGHRHGGLKLVRCPGRHENCSLWRVDSVSEEHIE